MTDDIIFSSGNGPDCYNEDDEECIPTESGEDDDIITTTIRIIRRPTPETEIDTETP